MATKNLNLGTVPVSRGEFDSTTIYYKDNIVQYKRSSYQVISESPIVGVPPINDEDIVNNGWIIFAGTLSEASLIKSNTQDLSGNNVQENLNSAAEKLKKLELEVVYDVSSHNNGTVFESLQAILSSSNLDTLIPTSVRHGGMTIRFIQGSVSDSDNKYVQYRLISDEWSTNTKDWAIAEERVYIENPEFVYIKTDNEGKILWAIKADGSIYYGAGIPQQIIDYIEENITHLPLEDVVTFLSDYLGGDTTLKSIIDNISNTKVDKEEGKGLISESIANTLSLEENKEYIKVITDSNKNTLIGIKRDGSIDWAKGIPTPIRDALTDIYILKIDKEKGKTLIAEDIANIFKLENNNEYIQAITDVDKKLLFGIKKDGSVEWNKGVPIPIELELNKKIDKENGKSLVDDNLLESFSIEPNKEYIKAIVDSDGHLIVGIRPDGTIQLSNNDIYQMSSTKEYLKVLVDKDNKVISYLDKKGIFHFNTTVVLDNIVYSNKIKKTLEEDLIKDGFRYGTDFSNDKLVELPIPSVCAKINILSKNMPTTKKDDFEGYIEYWDKEGNYFKKPIKSLNAQGSSSMTYWKKNYAFDLNDDSTIKFGNWVAQDSFHIKKYYIDCFRGQCVVGYRFAEQVFQSRGFGNVKPWDYLNTSTPLQSSGNIDYDFNIDALAHPDGFPVMVYHNGELLGLYALCLKKHRSNYLMNKSNQNHILLDGAIGTDTFFGRDVNWTEFEVRNPKIGKDINGNKYDGDKPTEPSDDFTLVKDSIRRLSYSMTDINENPTKETFKKYFNVDYCIDYFLISQVLFNFDGFRKNWIWGTWDGEKWSPTIYDLDSIFGSYANGAGVYPNSTTTIVGIIDEMVPIENRKNNMLPSYWIWNLYKDELSLRYKELRDSGIFSTDNIISILKDWVSACGYDNIKTDLFECCAIDGIPQTPSYRDGSLTYSQVPKTEGFYNSIYRIKKWLDERFTYLDSQEIFNYNN